MYDIFNVYFYVQVDHLEPWEKGSRKTSGQVGMCGGVSITRMKLSFFPLYETLIFFTVMVRTLMCYN